MFFFSSSFSCTFPSCELPRSISTPAAMSSSEFCNVQNRDNRDPLLKHWLSMETLESNIDAVPKRPRSGTAGRPQDASFVPSPAADMSPQTGDLSFADLPADNQYRNCRQCHISKPLVEFAFNKKGTSLLRTCLNCYSKVRIIWVTLFSHAHCSSILLNGSLLLSRTRVLLPTIEIAGDVI